MLSTFTHDIFRDPDSLPSTHTVQLLCVCNQLQDVHEHVNMTRGNPTAHALLRPRGRYNAHGCTSSTLRVIIPRGDFDCVVMAIRPATILPFLKGTRPYTLYVLCVLMIVFTLNQKDRFLLGVTSGKITKELNFGEKTCLPNSTSNFSSPAVCSKTCIGLKFQE